MLRIIFITILTILISENAFGQTKDFKIGITASYLSPPFSKLNFKERGMGYFESTIKSMPSFKAGLSLTKHYRNFNIGLSFDYLYTGFHIHNFIPAPDNTPQSVFLILHQSDIKIRYNDSYIFGLTGSYPYKKFEFGLGLKTLTLNYTTEEIPKRAFDHLGTLNYSSYNTDPYGVIIDKTPIGVLEYSRVEQHDLLKIKKTKFIPELIINYNITKNLQISTGLYAKFWSRNNAYVFHIKGLNTYDEDLNQTIDSEKVSFNEKNLSTKFITAHFGLKYQISLKKKVKPGKEFESQ